MSNLGLQNPIFRTTDFQILNFGISNSELRDLNLIPVQPSNSNLNPNLNPNPNPNPNPYLNPNPNIKI